LSCEINVKKRDFVTISVEEKTILLQLVAAKNDFLTYAIVTLFLDIKYNITWLNRTEPEPELRFDEPNRTRTKPLLQWTEPNLNQGLMNRTRTWTKVWWTEPEPELRFDEPNPNLTRSSVRFGSIGTLLPRFFAYYFIFLYRIF